MAKDRRELRLLPALCSKEGVALSVGANEGFFVHHLLPHAESVVAFEPLPQMLIRRRQSYTDKVQIVPATTLIGKAKASYDTPLVAT